MRDTTFVLAAGLTLAACHSPRPESAARSVYQDERGIDREAVLLSSWQPTYPQRCQIARLPETLPAPGSLISTADVPVLLEQGGIRDARGSALLSLKFDSTGHVERLRTIETTLDESTAAKLQNVLLSAIAPQAPGRTWGVRLRVDLDSTPRYRVGRSEHCAAAMIPPPGSHPGPLVSAGPVGASMQSGRRRSYSVKFAIALASDGTVTDVKPLGGSSVDPTVLESLTGQLRAQRWLPERDDGIPVATVFERTQRMEITIVGSPR